LIDFFKEYMMLRIFVYCAVVSLVFFVFGCGGGAFQVQVVPANRQLVETVIGGDRGFFVSDKIAIIDVDGVMANKQQGGLMKVGDNPVSVFLEKLDRAAGDKAVKAVVIRLNSPGGTVAGSDMMYHSLGEFKRKTGKPVVSVMMDLACSGAYYLACGTDGIVAQPSCVTGSIGTIMQTVSIEGTLEKIGVKTVAIKSGKLKDVASPFHDLSDEEAKLLQGIITDFYEQFLSVVANNRTKIEKSKLRELADGSVYTAAQALGHGLVDRIGYADDGIKWAKEMAAIKKMKIVIYHRPMGYKPNVYGTSAGASTGMAPLINIELPDWLNSASTQFLYLWQPGI